MTRARNLVRAIACTACWGLALGTPSASAQSDRARYEPRRTAWGTPDLEGVWDFRTLTPFERPQELAGREYFEPAEARAYREQVLRQLDVDNRTGEPSQADVEGAYNSFWWDWGTELADDLRTSLIVDPPDGRLPAITPEAEARREEQNRLRTPPVRDLFSYSANPAEFLPEGPESVGLSERCLVGFNAGPPLNPSAYNNNLRIVQTRDHVLLVTEMIHDARIVPLDGRPRLPAGMSRWSGESRGRWEGSTLVVETTGFSDTTPAFQLPATLETAMEAGAVGSGRDLHLVERFTPIAEGRLLYEYTLDAPGVFVRPFTVAIPMRASTERMFEYACHEGNHAMRGMLRGARLLESEAEGERSPTGSGR
jgi:hypothetical protein